MIFPTRRLANFLSRLLLILIVFSTSLFVIFGITKHFLPSHQRHFDPLDGHSHHRQLVKSQLREARQSLTIEKRRLLQQNDSSTISSTSSSSDSPKIGNKAIQLYVHLDLKGAAPKLSYLEKLFPLLHQLGAQGVCIEYEDMFPFEGIVSNVKHKQAFSKEDIQKINQLAEKNQLDVMPLLQTYGHLEFVLKLKEFADLRENARYPQVISPCLNKTYPILYAMIDQYLELHPNIRYFHIGHDEVYYFLSNPACQQFRQLTGIQTQYDLFAHHLNLIVTYIKTKRPKLNLFVWHDVLQNLNLQMVEKFNLLTNIVPVLWSYREDMSVEGFVVGASTNIFGQFPSLWGSSSYKGAAHEVATISDVKHYYENQFSWIQQLTAYIPNRWANFDGMIITGWSRYDHFLSLCELLPYSIPSMAFSLAAWKEPFKNAKKSTLFSNQALQQYVQEQLRCSSPLHLTIQEHITKPIPKCQFPGSAIYESMISLQTLWTQVTDAESFVDKFVTDLHVKYNYIHVKRGEECLDRLVPIMGILKNFVQTFRKSMDEIYPPQVAIEWLETYFMKRYRQVKKRFDFIDRAVKEQKTWPPRPIPDLDRLEDF